MIGIFNFVLNFFTNFTLLSDNSSVKGQLEKFKGSGGYMVYITTQLGRCVNAARQHVKSEGGCLPIVSFTKSGGGLDLDSLVLTFLF